MRVVTVWLVGSVSDDAVTFDAKFIFCNANGLTKREVEKFVQSTGRPMEIREFRAMTSLTNKLEDLIGSAI